MEIDGNEVITRTPVEDVLKQKKSLRDILQADITYSQDKLDIVNEEITTLEEAIE